MVGETWTKHFVMLQILLILLCCFRTNATCTLHNIFIQFDEDEFYMELIVWFFIQFGVSSVSNRFEGNDGLF